MSSRKPPSGSSDWDDFEIPTWDDSVPSAPTRSSSSSTSRSSASGNRQPYQDPLYDDYPQSSNQQRSGTANQPPTRLSSRVPARSTRPSQDPYRDPYSGYDDSYSGDPYYPESQYQPSDSQRTAASSQYDLYADSTIDTGWDQATGYDEMPAQKRGRTSRQRTRAARPGVSVSRPAISDGWLAAIVGVATLGLLAMAAVVWWGLGDIGSTIPWHLNASGDVDHWVSNAALWRVPFGVFMTMLMGVLTGVYLWKRDRFAARFIVTSLCLVQVLAWVAVIDQLW